MPTTLSIVVPDAAVTAIEDAVAARYGWTVELGVTKADFVLVQLRNWLKGAVCDEAAMTAGAAAGAVAAAAADALIGV
jgi:hypothetical protein